MVSAVAVDPRHRHPPPTRRERTRPPPNRRPRRGARGARPAAARRPGAAISRKRRGDQRSRFPPVFATTAIAGRRGAAVTWPAKIARGKFQGLMQANTPRPCKDKLVRFAGGALQPLRVGELLPRPPPRSSGKSPRPSRTSAMASEMVLPRLPHQRVHELRTAPFPGRSDALSRQAARAIARRSNSTRVGPRRRASNAIAISAGVASCTLPTCSRRSAGLVTGCVFPRQQDPIDDGPGNSRGKQARRPGFNGRRADTSLRSTSISGGLPKSIPARVAAIHIQRLGQGQPRVAHRDSKRSISEIGSRNDSRPPAPARP